MVDNDSHTHPAFCSPVFDPTLRFHPMPPTQPLPDTPAPSHPETYNMESEPIVPEIPSCDCGKPVQQQCGKCDELFFCDTPACFDKFHSSLRPRDQETHRASVTPYGTPSQCAQHPGQKLCRVCVDPACGDALLCMHCAYIEHAGHETVAITDYMKDQRKILRSHVEKLTAQRTAAKKECCVFEALPLPGARYDLLLQIQVVMRENVLRCEIACEEEAERAFLAQTWSCRGDVCALKTFVAKAGDMIAKCEAVCQLGDNQVLLAVTESQAVLRSINSMAASGDRHRLVGAAHPHATFSLKLPVSNVYDALAQRSAIVVQESAYNAIAALRALGETTLTVERLKQVTDQGSDPEVACLLLQAGVVNATPQKFFSRTAVTCIDISYASTLALIGDDFLNQCTALTTLNLSGLQHVAAIGDRFLFDCTSLPTVDLSALQNVTRIGQYFLHGCTSLSKVDLNGLQHVTSIGDGFLAGCTRLLKVDLSALQCVTRIGQHFLHGCTSLPTVDLNGLQHVERIGNGFVDECTSLYEVDLSALKNVTSIGDGFLAGCTRLSRVDLSALKNVTSIRDGFLAGCIRLSREVDLSALQLVTSIGDRFLFKCSSLWFVDLRALQLVTSIGDEFLGWCDDLRGVDLSGFHHVTSIGDRFIEICSQMDSVDLSALQAVTRIGHRFFFDTFFEEVDLSGLQSVVSIGDEFFGKSRLRRVNLSKCNDAVRRSLPKNIKDIRN